MALKIQDIIDVEQFQMLQDRLNEIYSFPSAIIDNDGNVLTATAWQDVCTKFHRQNSECEKECIKSDQYIASHLHEANPAVSYRCPHGLIDNATPIIIEGVHYGNFFTGQFFLEPPDLNFFRAQAIKYGFDEEAYIEAVKKVPIWTQQQLDSYLFFIKGLIEVISAIGLKNIKEIATRKRMQENEERFRTILQTAMEGFWLVDLQGRLLEVNETYCRMSGYSERELLAMRIHDLEAVETEDNTAAHIDKIMTQGEDHFGSRHRRKDGSIFDVEVSAHYQSTDGGRFIVFLRDITERRKAEKALQESEDRFRTIFEEAHLGIVITLPSFAFERANPAFCRMMGYSEAELRSMTFADITHPDHLMQDIDNVKKVGRGEMPFYQTEKRYISKSGKVLWGNLIVSSIRDEHGALRYYVSMVSDITENRQSQEEKRSLEERLQRAEKMEALGQLAGGVAHDLNNVLGILSGYSELLLEEIPEGSRSRRHVEKIMQSTERGAAIIEDLLTLARRGVTASDVINLNSVVFEFLKTPVFEKLNDFHPRVTFRTESDENLLNIKGSRVHLEKTLMNLVSNAAESVSGIGEVMIRTESRYLDKPLRGYDEAREGDYAVLTVSDTGMGIPAENIEKIFEPFYTRKKMGRSGTGLGLAIVWGTVKDHNGYIDIQTEIGKGTTFTLYFPVTREELIAQHQKEPIERYMGKGESVLVVDDIAEQRDIAARLLTRLGYQVHLASSGEEAVEYLRGNKADILVLDMIMPPGIDGLETYEKVLAISPKQKAIIVSGFSETERVKEAQRLGAGAYVKKPYVTEKIGVAIRDELIRK